MPLHKKFELRKYFKIKWSYVEFGILGHYLDSMISYCNYKITENNFMYMKIYDECHGFNVYISKSSKEHFLVKNKNDFERLGVYNHRLFDYLKEENIIEGSPTNKNCYGEIQLYPILFVGLPPKKMIEDILMSEFSWK